jgi:hypothetical protein
MASEKSQKASAKVAAAKLALRVLQNIQATDTCPLFDPNRHLIVDRSIPRPRKGIQQQPPHNPAVAGFQRYLGLTKHATTDEFIFLSDLKIIQGQPDAFTVTQCQVLSGTILFGCCKMDNQGQQCRHISPDHTGARPHASAAAGRHIFRPLVVWQVCLLQKSYFADWVDFASHNNLRT